MPFCFVISFPKHNDPLSEHFILNSDLSSHNYWQMAREMKWQNSLEHRIVTRTPLCFPKWQDTQGSSWSTTLIKRHHHIDQDICHPMFKHFEYFLEVILVTRSCSLHQPQRMNVWVPPHSAQNTNDDVLSLANLHILSFIIHAWILSLGGAYVSYNP